MYELHGTVTDSPPKQWNLRTLTTKSGCYKGAGLCLETAALISSSEVTSGLRRKTKVAMRRSRKVQRKSMSVSTTDQSGWKWWQEKFPSSAFTSILKEMSKINSTASPCGLHKPHGLLPESWEHRSVQAQFSRSLVLSPWRRQDS